MVNTNETEIFYVCENQKLPMPNLSRRNSQKNDSIYNSHNSLDLNWFIPVAHPQHPLEEGIQKFLKLLSSLIAHATENFPKFSMGERVKNFPNW